LGGRLAFIKEELQEDVLISLEAQIAKMSYMKDENERTI